ERHGDQRLSPEDPSADQLRAVLWFGERFRRRRREFADDAQGLEHGAPLIHEPAGELGVDWACDLFFAAEREYWQRRNRAARIQKARQDALGLGWANHDHHTYRASRGNFKKLVATWEKLGFV